MKQYSSLVSASVFLMLLMCHQNVRADNWLCTETASTQVSKNIYIACGIGESSIESEARSQSLKIAIEEFRGFCESSSHCRARKVEFSPKRTMCEKKENTYKCYRALTVTLGSSFKKVSLSSVELEREIVLRRKELESLKEKEAKLEELKDVENQIDKVKTEQGSMEEAELDLYQAEYLRNSNEPLLFKKISLGFGANTFNDANLTSFFISGGLEYLPLSYVRLVGLLGLSGAASSNKVGASAHEKSEHEVRGVDIEFSTGYSVTPIWLDVGLGYFTGGYGQYADETTGSGTKTGKVIQLREADLNLPFISLQIEYEREIAFFSIYFRKYLSSEEEINIGNEFRLSVGGKW